MRVNRELHTGWRFFAALFGLLLIGLVAGNRAAYAVQRPVTLPQLLSAQEAGKYREIFSLQSLGQMELAARLIAQLSDRRLLGDVLSQRYLHAAYVSSYRELQQWLAHYSDHPDAQAIYRLALRKQPATEPALHRPTPVRMRNFSGGGTGTEYRSGAQPMQVDWAAGLNAWRRGQFVRAGQYFSAIAQSATKTIAPWRKSAAAYWAARAALAQHKPQLVNQYLRLAANHPQTMYGILANRQLGREMPFDWRLPQLANAEFALLSARPAVARVVALAEVGQTERADSAMLMLYNRAPADDDDAMLALAVQLGLPVSQLRIAKVAHDDGDVWQAAFYPVPSWRPSGGFTADPALLYAFMRQESKFNATAQSPSGARGLMQLMPATASFIGNNRALNGAKRGQLFDPELNMTLGQRYIKHLLAQPGGKGDLFSLVAAYQAGPAKVERWLKQTRHGDDPLLFIESLPSEDTRRYLERVVTDYWLYQDRLGEPLRTLDAIAAGQWPVFPPRLAPQARLREAPARIDHDG